MNTIFEIENAVKGLSRNDLTAFRDWFLAFDESHAIVAKPVLESTYTLEDLVANITDENRHGEIDSGPPVGNEFW